MKELINNIKDFKEFLNEKHINIWNKYGDKLPEIFRSTKYALPTKGDLIDINSFNLTSEDIIQGFSYTIIGRGMTSKDNKLKVLTSIKMLSDLYPDNKEYSKAMNTYKIEFLNL